LRTRAESRNLKQAQGFHLAKHLNWRILPDVLQLRRQINDGEFDVIHSHLDNDTLTAVMAGCAPRLVRTVYAGEPWKLKWRQRAALSRAALILTASRRVRDYLAGLFPAKTIRDVHIPVDLDHFAPRPKDNRLLAEFNIGDHQPVAGIVARVQRHRRFDLLLQALEIVASEIPEIKFLIIGRGTHLDEIARHPVQQMGLHNNVVFTGYREADYADVLNLLDFKVFLVPGSDGACRAVRESLACAKPVVTTRRGILPELIADGKTGHLVDENPESLARAMIGLCKDRLQLKKLAENALAYAGKNLNPDHFVCQITACYEELLDGLERK
jgi:glycosyltransferase involved in cell wall biosynthesis